MGRKLKCIVEEKVNPYFQKQIDLNRKNFAIMCGNMAGEFHEKSGITIMFLK